MTGKQSALLVLCFQPVFYYNLIVMLFCSGSQKNYYLKVLRTFGLVKNIKTKSKIKKNKNSHVPVGFTEYFVLY